MYRSRGPRSRKVLMSQKIKTSGLDREPVSAPLSVREPCRLHCLRWERQLDLAARAGEPQTRRGPGQMRTERSVAGLLLVLLVGPVRWQPPAAAQTVATTSRAEDAASSYRYE